MFRCYCKIYCTYVKECLTAWVKSDVQLLLFIQILHKDRLKAYENYKKITKRKY